MSTLYLVRHAQASFLSDNYDKLSSLGETQSSLLGGHMVNAGLDFDRVLMGPRDRQQKTAQLVGRVFQDASRPWPAVELAPALDEYQGEELIKRALPRLVANDIHLQTLAAAVAESEHSDMRTRMKTFQKMFEHVMRAWVRGEIHEDGVEPWADFKRRIGSFVAGLQEDPGKGSRVAAFTSGGAVAAIVQCALGLDDVKTVELSWMVRNASITEIAFRKDKLTLSSFNAVPHLQYERLITYR